MAQTEILTNLTNYINELNTDLLREAVLNSRFTEQISHMPGIKNGETVNFITSQLVLTAPACGAIISPTGSVTVFQNTMQMCPVAVNEVLCYTDFETKYFGMFAKAGSYNEFPPSLFTDVYVADKIDKIGEAIEYGLIAGSTTGTFSTTATTLCNGLLYLLTSTSATASIVNVSPLLATYSVTTAIAYMDVYRGNLNNEILTRDDITLWCSYADYLTYIQAIRNANYFHFNALESEGNLKYEMYHPGTNMKISACHGLDAVTNGKHYMFATTAANLFYGYDDIKDPQNFQFWYSLDLNAACFRAQWKQGIQAGYYKYITFGISN